MCTQGQEAQYAAKLAAVKEEHDKLLQEAFEKAKVSFMKPEIAMSTKTAP